MKHLWILLLLSGCGMSEPKSAEAPSINTKYVSGEILLFDRGCSITRFVDKEAHVVCYGYCQKSISCLPEKP